MKRFLIIFLCSVCPVMNAYAADGLDANFAEIALTERKRFIAENGDLTFKKIQVEGLVRTKPRIVSREFRRYLNRPLSRVDLKFSLDRLHRKGIFSKISVRYHKDNEDGAAIVVRAEDKWTLLPVPVLNVTRGVQTYGLFIYEPNFLGRYKTLFGGFLGSNIGLQGLVGYIDNHLNNSDFFFKQVFEGGRVRHDNGLPDGSRLESYEVSFARTSAQFGYLINQILLANLLIRAKFSSVAQDETLQSSRAGSANSIGAGAHFALRAAKHRGYYKEGFTGFLEMIQGFAITQDGSNYNEVTGRLRYTAASFADHSLSFTALGATGNRTAVDESRLGSLEGSRTLPTDYIAADHYFSHTLRYEHPVLKFNWGIFTITEFFESGIYQNDDLGEELFYGPGIGFRFYVKNVALPAIGLDWAFEVKSGSTQLSFSIGFVR